MWSKTLTFTAIITSVILLSGTLGFVLSNPDAFASGQEGGNDNGKADHGQQGCDTAAEASEGKTVNPHCEETNSIQCTCGNFVLFPVCTSITCGDTQAEEEFCIDECIGAGGTFSAVTCKLDVKGVCGN